jgi:hypothetical protein
MLGSTPAMMEKEIASGISASATTRPARISVRAILGESHAVAEAVARAVRAEQRTRRVDLTCSGAARRGGHHVADDAAEGNVRWADGLTCRRDRLDR